MWLYFRFTLSIRDVEELLAWRSVEVRRESVRVWTSTIDLAVSAGETAPRRPH